MQRFMLSWTLAQLCLTVSWSTRLRVAGFRTYRSQVSRNLSQQPPPVTPAAAASVSVTESDGFFDESASAWAMRKARHANQMQIQKTSFEQCPPPAGTGNAVVDAGIHACFPSCDATQHAAVMMWETCHAPQPCPAPTISPSCEANYFWQIHFEPSFSCEFERRIGRAGEGGKWVCDPEKITEKANKGEGCLVYSIGSNGQYDFEEAVRTEVSDKCEIHTIDMNDWSVYTQIPPPAYVNYHKYRLGTPPAGTAFSTVLQDLGHKGRTIDIFKIDCEGCEWDTFQDWLNADVYIRQIQVEIHYTGKGVGHNAFDFFRLLFDKGYVVFNKEPNTIGCGGKCLEYSFLKLSPQFTKPLA